jgi:hypothetical protein
MTVGRKKVCYGILREKIECLKWKGIADTIFYLIGFFVAMIVIFSGFLRVFSYASTSLWEQTFLGVLYDTLISVFMYLGFPLVFIKAANKHWRRRKGLIEASMVQIVEVTLLPKMTIGTDK